MSNVRYLDFRACMDLVSERMIREVPTINAGGCAFFASELIKRMRDVGITNINVAIFGDPLQYDTNKVPNVNDVEHEMILNECDLFDLEDWNANGVSFAHVAIEWGGTHWDAIDPFVDDYWKCWPRYEGSFNEEVLHYIGQSPDGWNPAYDRDQDERVRDILDESFDLLH
jgi:hypothetical protein